MIDLAGNGAVISPCEVYRYRLDRHVGAGSLVAFLCGVNPSTADASIDDHTVSKWRGFGQRLGWRRFMVGNVFGYRATSVRELATAEDPFGPSNAQHITDMMAEADVLVPCWGRREKVPKMLRGQFDVILNAMRDTGKPMMCWGRTAGGDPLHVLTLGYDTPFVAFDPEGQG